ncbi:MAG: pyroglutamyl-peptidase I [Planctomycetota bacterium]
MKAERRNPVCGRARSRRPFPALIAGTLALSILAISGLGCERAREAAPPSPESTGPGTAVSEETAPRTILLTGFEPFGGFPRNASWEAVLPLDGESVEGVRLRTVQLPVRWGVPLPALREACSRWRPVAVFGFGQGRPGSIRFERVADNERRQHPDNDGRKPPASAIVEGGPLSFTSAFAFEKVMASYRGPRIPWSASNEAGGYLCEECLYALETVRREVAWDMDAAFFHVPALGSPWKVAGEMKPCHESTLADFVRGLVRAWIVCREKPPRQTAESPK